MTKDPHTMNRAYQALDRLCAAKPIVRLQMEQHSQQERDDFALLVLREEERQRSPSAFENVHQPVGRWAGLLKWVWLTLVLLCVCLPVRAGVSPLQTEQPHCPASIKEAA